MAKFRKRPIVVEAYDFDGIPAHDPPGVFRREEDNSPYVVTIHGQRTPIVPGDKIIQEPDGVHYYPCKLDIFEKSYESAGGQNDAEYAEYAEDLKAIAEMSAICAQNAQPVTIVLQPAEYQTFLHVLDYALAHINEYSHDPTTDEEHTIDTIRKQIARQL